MESPEDGPSNFVTISRQEYERLQDAERRLICLDAGGVDNWEWYGESLKDCGYWDEQS